ncbi:MAG: hypothetical protein NTU98_13740 [Bacteroidetes bacterium]|nr:hypothetical protein [Bacteroidota bacterium]
MKKSIPLLFCIVSLVLAPSTHAQTQGLKLCYIDSKTGDTIKATYWKRLIKTSDYLVNFCVSQKNSQRNIELKFHFGEKEDFSVSDTNSLWIKLANGTTIKLKSRENVTSKKGVTATAEDPSGLTMQGAYVFYPISHKQSIEMQSTTVEKIRIFTSRGFDTIKLDGSGMNLMADSFRENSISPKKYKVMDTPGEDEIKPEPW